MAEIGAIPDVSTAEASALAALGLHTTDDLLRTERGALVRRVGGLSPARVKGWQAVAELAQLGDLAFDDAVLLHDAGADGLDEFAGWSLARLRSALPHVEDDSLLDLVKDAVRLRHTGVVNGTVTLRDGTPVRGADVTVAGEAATTDGRGRFRVVRLPLDRKVVLTVHHPRSGYRLDGAVPVVRHGALEGHTVVLSGRARSAPVLSERRGDRLPPLGGSVVTVRVENTPPEPDDLLLLLDRYADGSFRVASRFLDFEGGRFVRRTYRLPVADLPPGVTGGDGLEWSGTAWVSRGHSGRDVARRIRTRQARRRLGPPATDEAEALSQAGAVLRAASDPGRRTR